MARLSIYSVKESSLQNAVQQSNTQPLRQPCRLLIEDWIVSWNAMTISEHRSRGPVGGELRLACRPNQDQAHAGGA